VHAWSNWARRSFIDDYGVEADRVIVNPPGIDTALWQRPSPLTATNDSVRVLFVGADFERKGGSMLLDWHRRQDPARITLVIATRDEVPSTAGVEVHRGLSPNSPELRKLFHGADLFALPSAGECFGIATVEAMAAGLPVIASDAGGSADIIDDGVNGAIVRAGDQSSLDAALDHLSSSGDARVTFGAASAVRARQLFDVHTTAARTIESLHSIAGSRPALRST